MQMDTITHQEEVHVHLKMKKDSFVQNATSWFSITYATFSLMDSLH